MKHTLNATGQAAIVQFLEDIGLTGRPWSYFSRAEVLFNEGDPTYVFNFPHTATYPPRVERLTLESDWFDTAPEPATFEEVVAVLIALCTKPAVPPTLWEAARNILARCPKAAHVPVVNAAIPEAPARPMGMPVAWGPTHPGYGETGPFPSSVDVRITTRLGTRSDGKVSDFSWLHDGRAGDIVIYQAL